MSKAEKSAGLIASVRRIDADRVKRVMKQNADSVKDLNRDELKALVGQAEADMKRCYSASEDLRTAGGLLADVYIIAMDEAARRGVTI